MTDTAVRLIARPRRIRRWVIPIAALLVAASVVIAVLLPHSYAGANFYPSDQVALVLIGLVLAAAVLTPLWPVVRADADGVEVRNLVPRRFDWAEIRGVSFPDGAWWARLELPGDEYVPVVAVQAFDGQRAVDAIRELRHLHRDANAPASSDQP
ncbi:MAG: PH domain-containing protein [Sciscionella sp.]|nr:PH domain-containing protein [Sciscionella sp.]